MLREHTSSLNAVYGFWSAFDTGPDHATVLSGATVAIPVEHVLTAQRRCNPDGRICGALADTLDLAILSNLTSYHFFRGLFRRAGWCARPQDATGQQTEGTMELMFRVQRPPPAMTSRSIRIRDDLARPHPQRQPAPSTISEGCAVCPLDPARERG